MIEKMSEKTSEKTAVTSSSTSPAGAEVVKVIDELHEREDDLASNHSCDSDCEAAARPEFFSDAGKITELLMRPILEGGKDQCVSVEKVQDILDMTIRCLYECVKDCGRLSVVVTQSKQDAWHEEQDRLRLDKTEEEKKQWIISGYGHDKIVSSEAINGVCRHNPTPGKVLRIANVNTDSRTKDSWYSANGLRGYCGMRLTALPECTLCALWVGEDHPENTALCETSRALRQLMVSLDKMVDSVLRNIVTKKSLNVAEQVVHSQERQARYVCHEISNQLAPLVVLNDTGEDVDADTIKNSLDAVFSILKDPTGQALKLQSVLAHQNIKRWCEMLSFFCKRVINKADVVFESDYKSSLPDNTEVYFDGAKLRQAVVNIVINAQKFTQEGKITWKTRVDASQTNPEKEAVVHIEIEDTGCGISADEIPLVTEMFMQVGELNKRREGSGIGLAVTKAVVERLHGGTLEISSEVGVGTTVSIRITCQCRQA